jgi:hypothetical protein
MLLIMQSSGVSQVYCWSVGQELVDLPTDLGQAQILMYEVKSIRLTDGPPVFQLFTFYTGAPRNYGSKVEDYHDDTTSAGA